MKAFNENDEEIEVFSAEEHNAAIARATEETAKKKDDEFAPIRAGFESEIGTAKKALGDRAGEFKHFRELHQDVVDKLSIAERTIYENQKSAEADRVKREEDEKKRTEITVDTVLRAKAGTNEKLLTKMKDMWNIIGINAVTPDEIEQKTKMILGAISTTEPDLVATALGSFSGGGWKPPEEKKEGEKTFADTEKGESLMKDIGLVIPKPDVKK